jgi:hypothetical protein
VALRREAAPAATGKGSSGLGPIGAAAVVDDANSVWYAWIVVPLAAVAAYFAVTDGKVTELTPRMLQAGLGDVSMCRVVVV